MGNKEVDDFPMSAAAMARKTSKACSKVCGKVTTRSTPILRTSSEKSPKAKSSPNAGKAASVGSPTSLRTASTSLRTASSSLGKKNKTLSEEAERDPLLVVPKGGMMLLGYKY